MTPSKGAFDEVGVRNGLPSEVVPEGVNIVGPWVCGCDEDNCERFCDRLVVDISRIGEICLTGVSTVVSSVWRVSAMMPVSVASAGEMADIAGAVMIERPVSRWFSCTCEADETCYTKTPSQSWPGNANIGP